MSPRSASTLAVLLCTGVLQGQPSLSPVIDQRGVINAFTQTPAPSTVSPGGIIWIKGLNLGPAAGATASGLPLPVEIGDPPVRVLINGRPAPLFSADPSKIVAQVPLETGNGLANVVVRRNGVDSRIARINVVALLPGLETRDESGFGELKSTKSGNKLTFQATGLGVTEPRTATGAAASADSPARPRANFDVHAGGILVESDIRASTTVPGQFDITVTLPETVRPGDTLTLSGNGRIANLATHERASQVETTFVPLPSGAPDIRAMASSDLRGGFLIASAARTEEGCYPSVLFDIREKTASNISGCLTAANRNAQTPVVAANDSATLAAFVGPPQGNGTPGQPVSNKVMVFRPSAKPMGVDLPLTATQLLGVDGTNIAAVAVGAAGTPPQVATINTVTGEVSEGGLTGIIGGGGAGGGGAGGGIAINILNLRVDLGGGLDKVLTPPAAVAPGQLIVLVGDDSNNPTAAKIAVLNQQGEVTASRDYPADWLPMVMPTVPANPNQPIGGRPELPGVIVNPFRVGNFTDGQTRTVYFVSRKADDSANGLVAVDVNNAKAIPTPARTFIPGCSNVAQAFSIETSRRLIYFASNTLTRTYQATCNAVGFLSFDLTSQQFTTVELSGSGQVNATGGGSVDINDFVLTASTGGDTLYAIDGVTQTSYRFDLPQGVVGIAGIAAFPQLGIAVGVGRQRVNGDAGFLILDLERVETRQLLLPDGFAQVQLLGILTASRKLVARGTKTNNASSQYLIYDLASGEVTFADNPDGVTFVAQVPVQQPGGGGQGQGQGQAAPPMQRLNVKANSIEAVTFGADRRANGAILIRVP